MMKNKKPNCVFCGEKGIGLIKVEPLGYFHSKCIFDAIEKLNEAHDILYRKFIYPHESKIIRERLDEPDFDLDDYIKNNPNFPEEDVFEVVADMVDEESNKDVILDLMKTVRIKTLGEDYIREKH